MAYRGTGLVPFFGSNFPALNLRREIDRLFEDAGMPTAGRWIPAADVREDDNAIDIDIELAGLDPDDVDITVENGVLTVSGEKRTEREEGKEGQYHVVERRYGSFVRSFQLPQGVDESKISARFDNGLLTIEIPKSALPQPRRVQIGASGGQQVQGNVGREQVSSGRSSSSKSSGEKMAASGTEQQDTSSQEKSSRK
ncbi:MAG TPA: Hsp20/alpha crystallin family protein [Gemmatimonadaceae bacterium]|nr:Hsp20/alpha crystallin family protein [Gemmatimonadaceae bacterium]